jgi:hypothetical protein
MRKNAASAKNAKVMRTLMQTDINPSPFILILIICSMCVQCNMLFEVNEQ